MDDFGKWNKANLLPADVMRLAIKESKKIYVRKYGFLAISICFLVVFILFLVAFLSGTEPSFGFLVFLCGALLSLIFSVVFLSKIQESKRLVRCVQNEDFVWCKKMSYVVKYWWSTKPKSTSRARILYEIEVDLGSDYGYSKKTIEIYGDRVSPEEEEELKKLLKMKND